MVKKSLECFTKNNSKKENQQEFRDEKVIERKNENFLLNGNKWIDKKEII